MKYLHYKDGGYQSFIDSIPDSQIEALLQEGDRLVYELPEEEEPTPGSPIRMTEAEYITELLHEKYSPDAELAITKDALKEVAAGRPLPEEFLDMENERDRVKQIAKKEPRLREKKNAKKQTRAMG